MNTAATSTKALTGLTVLFLALMAAFLLNLWGRPNAVPAVPLVDSAFTNTATVRLSAAELIRTGGDASALECYAWHDKKEPVKLRFDANQDLIIPKEHEDIVKGHGRHNRNNHCFNCHDEANLELLQTRDGRELKLVNSTPLCGSCHGPTYRDWEAGAHGRTSGYWDRQLGAIKREDCVSCHNPHAPAFPARKPAPGPRPLHSLAVTPAERGRGH